MKMHLESPEQRLISGYGPGTLAVDGKDYSTPILITPQRVIADWYTPDVGDNPLASLTIAAFDALLNPPEGEELVEICLLGTGKDHRFPPMPLIAELGEAGIALEAMHTRAACRTYSVLINEGRPVAAALLQI